MLWCWRISPARYVPSCVRWRMHSRGSLTIWSPAGASSWRCGFKNPSAWAGASKVQEKSLKRHIAWLDKRIEEIETDLRQRLRASPAWRAKYDLLRSIPGAGDTTSATLLAKLPELGTLDRKGIAALAGLAPLANDSGKQRGRRSSAGACRCALCAIHVDRCGYPVQSRPPRFRRPPEGRRETREGRDRRLHAQAPQHHERHASPRTLNSLDNEHGCSPISVCPPEAPPRAPARAFDRFQLAFYEGPVVKPRRQIISNLLWLFSSACAEKVSAGVIHALSTDEDFLSIVVGGQRVNNSGLSDQH